MPGIIDVFNLKDGNAPLELEVIIGYAGKAATIVKLNDTPINGVFTDSFKYQIGPNSDLNMKELKITSLVSKIIRGSNKSSFAVILRNAGHTNTYRMDDDSDLNPVDYRAVITLIQ